MSEDDGDGLSKKTAMRTVYVASTAFARRVSNHTNNGRSTSQAEFSSSSTSKKKRRVITNSHHQVDTRQGEDGRHIDFAANTNPTSADADVASRANDPEMNGLHTSAQGHPTTSTGSHHQAATNDEVVKRKTSTFEANSGIDDRRDEDGGRVDDDAIAIDVNEGDVPKEDAQDCDVSDKSDSSPSNLVSVKRC